MFVVSQPHGVGFSLLKALDLRPFLPVYFLYFLLRLMLWRHFLRVNLSSPPVWIFASEACKACISSYSTFLSACSIDKGLEVA